MRFHRLYWLAAGAGVCLLLNWVATHLPSERNGAGEMKGAAPPADYPPQSQTARNNNLLMQMGLVGDLDGTAVVYAREADGLIDADGGFRTELSPAEAASILKRPASELSKANAPDQLDPDAILFQALAGTLTASARARSREIRDEQRLQGKTPDFVRKEWIIKKYHFSLDRLRHPTREERLILEAISRAKRAVLPRPGVGIHATPILREDFEWDEVAISHGMLPPEEPTDLP